MKGRKMAIQCQSAHCEKDAVWRMTDNYRRGKSSYVFLYYLCEMHKRKHQSGKTTAGHRSQYNLI